MKTFSVTTPTSTNILPSTGYDAMSRVFLQYNVPYQSKTVTVTSNGTTNVYPDSGYYGLTGVTIETNVSPQQMVPKLRYICLSNNFNMGSYIDISTETFTYAQSSTTVTIPDGKTIVVLTYKDNNIIHLHIYISYFIY